MSYYTSKAGPSIFQVLDSTASQQEWIENKRAYATKVVKDNERDAKRAAWRLLELCFPLEFFKLTGSPLPLALQKAKPKTKWEIEKAA